MREMILFAPVAFFIVMLMQDPGMAIAYGLVALVIGYPVVLLIISFLNRLQRELDNGRRKDSAATRRAKP